MKMLMKLCIFAFFVAFAVAFMASCHGENDRPVFEIPSEFDTSKEYEITFWAKNENNGTQRAVYEDAIAKFESYYPNIKVTIKHYTDYGEIYNDVITNIQTGTAPNVCITYPDHVATYITGENVVVPLDGLINDRRFGFGGSKVVYSSPDSDEIAERFLSECYVSDILYALPFMRSTEACYINKDFVEALGYEIPDVLTWDFVFEVSAAALEKDATGKYKLNGQKIMKPLIYKSTDNMMIQMLEQLDAGYSSVEGDIEIFNEDTKEILYMVSENTAKGAFSTFKIDSYPGNFLNKGQCIFAIDSTAGSTWMGCDAPLIDVPEDSLAEFETVVRPIPQFDVDNPEMISQGPSLCIFNKEDPVEVLSSWLFAQFLLTDEVQMAYSMTEGYAPVTYSAQNNPEYESYLSARGLDNDTYYSVKIDATKLLIDNMDNTFTAPVYNGSTLLRNAAGQLIENVTKDTRRKKVIDDEYMEKMFEEVSALYKLDQIEKSESRNLGEMPKESVLLLSTIGAIWLCIAAASVLGFIKNKKNKERKSVDKVFESMN